MSEYEFLEVEYEFLEVFEITGVFDTSEASDMF